MLVKNCTGIHIKRWLYVFKGNNDFVYLAHALNCNTKTNGTKTVDTGYAAHICFICTGLRIRDRGNATRLQYMYMAKATLCIFVVVVL